MFRCHWALYVYNLVHTCPRSFWVLHQHILLYLAKEIYKKWKKGQFEDIWACFLMIMSWLTFQFEANSPQKEWKKLLCPLFSFLQIVILLCLGYAIDIFINICACFPPPVSPPPPLPLFPPPPSSPPGTWRKTAGADSWLSFCLPLTCIHVYTCVYTYTHVDTCMHTSTNVCGTVCKGVSSESWFLISTAY